MTPWQQIRLAGLTFLVTTGLGVLLQTTTQAFWFYEARPAGKGGGVIHDLMVIWPTMVLLLIPLVVSAAFLCWGCYQQRRMTQLGQELK